MGACHGGASRHILGGGGWQNNEEQGQPDVQTWGQEHV